MKNRFFILMCALSATSFSSSSLPTDAAQSALPTSGIESSDTLDKLGEKTKDANKALGDLIEKLRLINDYAYESAVYTYSGRNPKPKTDTGKFYFKKENRIRVESTSGKTSGSIVVRRKDGLVRAKAGPMLLGITMTLHEDSALLNAGDGTNVLHSDLLSQMVGLHENLRAGGKGVISTRAIPNNNESVFVLDVCPPGQDSLGDRIILNASTGLPLELIHYNKGEVFSRTMVNNLRVNSNIPDNLFEI